MKTSLAAILTTGLLFAGAPVLAANKDSIRFDATITADEIVNKTCTVRATKSGVLAPNADMNVLSSQKGDGKMGEIIVKTGGIDVSLGTSSEYLYMGENLVDDVTLLSGIKVYSVLEQDAKNDLENDLPLRRMESEVNILVEKLLILDGDTTHVTQDEIEQLKMEVAAGNNLKSPGNSNKVYKVWFEAVRPPPGVFEAGSYKGLTTVTCEPAG